MIVRLPAGLIVMPSDKVHELANGDYSIPGFLLNIDEANKNRLHRYGCRGAKMAYEPPASTKGMWYYCPTRDSVERVANIAGIEPTPCSICNP